ncbi:termination factor Rho [Metasolibacillus sp.]|uniref:termination factor Rho n=1 Tax=Metasolibacillus sp. TaxID=2703680 RepID=UPI0025DB5A21|nr:termination factor Rho [Metasolibacillus sp.]MCT6925397.1 termination factor Rho [Metasolibacillus sp.]MCT6941576.1 termination factor Rho [Metasolibacillus sp.]
MAEKYKVVQRFKEVKHGGHIYEVNDYYPVEGKRATKARLNELSTTENKYNSIFIVAETSDDNDTD